MDLEPVEDLDLDPAILEMIEEPYCASCVHLQRGEPGEDPFCTRWEEYTEIKPGWACPEYTPQGFE